MAEDIFDYPKMVEAALLGVVREALRRTARDGLRGGRHFYISFRIGAPGVAVPEFLLTKYPEEMTVVLQNQFWGLEVGEDAFSVTLSFQNRPERLTVPFAAITGFADPSVHFALRFEVPAIEPAAPPAAAPEAQSEKRPPEGAEVVALDKFRKR